MSIETTVVKESQEAETTTITTPTFPVVAAIIQAKIQETREAKHLNNGVSTEERDRLHNHLKIADWDDKKWKREYTQLRENYLAQFYKYLAAAVPSLSFEKNEPKVYYVYNEKVGIYESTPLTSVQHLVAKLLIDEGFQKEACETVTRSILLKFCGYFPERAIDPTAFDTEEGMVHASNGWVNLKTLELTPHTPNILSTRVLRAAYDPAATCPTYDKFLDIDTGLPADQIRVLDQFSGYTLTNSIKHQALLILIGRPGSGKSTIADAWGWLLGSRYAKLDLDQIASDAKRFMGANLAGRSLLHYDEADVNRSKLGTSLLNLVSSPTIQVERKSVNRTYDVINTSKSILTTNVMPHSLSDGVYRRTLSIEMNNSFHDNGTINPDMPALLKSEASGILNRMLKGLHDLNLHGKFTVMAGHMERIEALKESSDTVAEFMSTFFQRDRAESEFYSCRQLYLAFTVENQHAARHYTPLKLGKALATIVLDEFKGIRPARTSIERGWTGFKLKQCYKFTDDGRIVLTGSPEALADEAWRAINGEF